MGTCKSSLFLNELQAQTSNKMVKVYLPLQLAGKGCGGSMALGLQHVVSKNRFIYVRRSNHFVTIILICTINVFICLFKN